MICRVLCVLASLFAFSAVYAAELDQVFGDRMVLQRDQPITLSGTGTPRESVSVTLAGVVRPGKADGSGHWKITFPAMPAGGPHELMLRGGGGSVRTFSDVLIGDLWLCSGQSNMYFPVSQSTGKEDDTFDTRESVRLLTVPQDSHARPQPEFGEPLEWLIADAASIPGFSAVCFFFALELQRTHPVPIGLVHSSWGGAQIEAWMSADSLEVAGGFEDQLALLRTYGADAGEGTAQFAALWEEWWRHSVSATERPWERAAKDNPSWRPIPAMRDWKTFGDEALADHDGMVWYRKTFTLDEEAKQGAQLLIGGIDEVDVTWINGEFVGSQFGWGTERTYAVPDGILRAGENYLVVNVLSTWDSGGMLGPEDSIRLEFADGHSRSLAEGWQYRRVPLEFGLPPRAPWESIGGLTGLFNAMIAPLQGLRLAGALWYQGESNAGNAAPYAGLLGALIDDWRRRFGGSLAFLVVQLPNFGAQPSGPSDSGWAAIRDAQRRVARADPDTGLVVTVDAGDRFDLHPPNKQIVAQRAAGVARALLFGKPGIVDGLSPARAVRRDDEIVIDFELAGDSLLVAGHDKPIAFELCSDDPPRCRYADARLRENRIQLAGAGVQDATRVRHCWADAPICNLYGASGLPVGSFEIAIESQDPSR